MEHIKEMDIEDESGLVALREWDTVKECRNLVSKEINKVLELSATDWIAVFLYVNEKPILKIPLFKELFIFGERSGLNECGIFEWKPYKFGPYSENIDEGLEILKANSVIAIERGKTQKGHIYYSFTLKKTEDVKKIWKLLPPGIKKILETTINEFKGKSSKEIMNYVYASYPKMAIKAINR